MQNIILSLRFNIFNNNNVNYEEILDKNFKIMLFIDLEGKTDVFGLELVS